MLFLTKLALLVSGKHSEAREALEKALQMKRSTKTLIVYGLASLGSLGTKIFLTFKQLQGMLASNKKIFLSKQEEKIINLIPEKAYP
jgi:hypothetical protein